MFLKVTHLTKEEFKTLRKKKLERNLKILIQCRWSQKNCHVLCNHSGTDSGEQSRDQEIQNRFKVKTFFLEITTVWKQNQEIRYRNLDEDKKAKKASL